MTESIAPRPQYAKLLGLWRTPKGNPATFAYRADTNDWNTLTACVTQDEYELRDLSLTGWALDVGAYLGGVSIALALDNPELQVIAVEPVPDNARLTRLNIGLNHLTDRIHLLEGAAGAAGDKMLSIDWGYRGSELAEHHAFVGNMSLATGADHQTTECLSFSLHDLLVLSMAHSFAFAKIDCEGCEASFLTSPAVGKVTEWRGEWHPPHIDEVSLHALLDATHEVTTWGPGPGGFRAVRR